MLPGFVPLLAIILFTFKQQHIRHKMAERMEEQLLHRIVLRDNDVRWVKKDKEIWVNGKMFDIKSMEHKNGMTVFYGLYDDEETALKESLARAWKKDLPGQQSQLTQLFQCLQGIYFNQYDHITILSKESTGVFVSPSPKLPSRYENVPTPPPVF